MTSLNISGFYNYQSAVIDQQYQGPPQPYRYGAYEIFKADLAT
jgi:hypothetical protein